MEQLLTLAEGCLPKSNEENPFAQIDHVYNRCKKLEHNSKSAKSYDDTIKVFKKYVEDVTLGADLALAASIKEVFTYDGHFRFYQWLVAQNGRYSLTTIRNHLSKLKKVIIYSRKHKYIKHEVSFVSLNVGNVAPTTDHRTAYNDKLYGLVRDFLEKEYRSIRTNLGNYAIIHQDLPGIDPRIESTVGPHGDSFLRVLKWGQIKGDRGITVGNFEKRDATIDDPMCSVTARRALNFWADLGIFEKHKFRRNTYKYVFVREPTGEMLRAADPKSYGWNNIDNLIWYVSNVLGGEIPKLRYWVGGVGGGGKNYYNSDLERRFVAGISKVGGIKKFKKTLEERGLAYKDSKRVSSIKICNLMAMLAMITALNAESIISLNVDCIKNERVSGKPCLQYVKNRSNGKKALPLFDDDDKDIYSDSSHVESGIDSMLYFSLLPNADIVEDIVETILKVTEDIRKCAPVAVAKKLFIFQQPKGNNVGGKVQMIRKKQLSPWSVQFKKNLAGYLKERAQKQNLTADAQLARETEIDELISTSTINISKFRASLATDLALAGASIEMIQAVLGHRSRQTTKLYLERHKMEIAYHHDVTSALERIKTGCKLHIVHCEDEGDLARSVSRDTASGVDDGYIFKTGTPLFCRNPYNPSDDIKASIKGWEDGKSVCHRWNKCLFCDKVVIVDLALPKLMAYHNQLKLDLSSGIDMTPGKVNLLMKTVAVIDKIIDPEGDFFDAKIIADARTRADIFSAQEADLYFNEGVGAWS